MTCIVGLVDGDKIYMGCDSRVSAGSSVLECEHKKIYKVNDKMMIGTAGDVRYANVIRHVFSPPDPLENQSNMDYLCSLFVPKLMKCLDTEKCMEVDKNVGKVPGRIILTYNGKLYSIARDYCVLEHPSYYAIGSGGDYALGSLYMTEGIGIDPVIRINKALDAACKFDAGCAPPFTILEM